MTTHPPSRPAADHDIDVVALADLFAEVDERLAVEDAEAADTA